MQKISLQLIPAVLKSNPCFGNNGSPSGLFRFAEWQQSCHPDKHQFGGFCYHFWSSAVPKLDRYQKKNEPDPLSRVKQEPEKEKIIKTLTAAEGYVLFAGIAMGIIQMLCLKYASDTRVLCCRYLRTPSKEVVSEAGMMEYLRRNFFRFMAVSGDLTITKIISDKQEPLKEEENDLLIS